MREIAKCQCGTEPTLIQEKRYIEADGKKEPYYSAYVECKCGSCGKKMLCKLSAEVAADRAIEFWNERIKSF